jgi:hypothetical protein
VWIPATLDHTGAETPQDTLSPARVARTECANQDLNILPLGSHSAGDSGKGETYLTFPIVIQLGAEREYPGAGRRAELGTDATGKAIDV